MGWGGWGVCVGGLQTHEARVRVSVRVRVRVRVRLGFGVKDSFSEARRRDWSVNRRRGHADAPAVHIE